MKSRVLVVLGTRPEAIKLAPLILRLREAYDTIETRVVATGQHRELLDQALAEFSIEPEINLELMQERQDHAQLLARAVERLSEVYRTQNPNLIVAQGDTTSVLAAALAAFYQKIPFAHVEAGLRTGDRTAPFPEEQNRILVSHCALLHFPPTELAARTCFAKESTPKPFTSRETPSSTQSGKWLKRIPRYLKASSPARSFS